MSDNLFIEINTVQDLMKHWPFFIEGLAGLNKSVNKPDFVIKEDKFLKVLLFVISTKKEDGRIVILTSKNHKPLGFIVAFDDTDRFSVSSAIVYALYSNQKCPTAVKELTNEIERWARQQGFEELHAVSFRINGAALRWIERKLGYERMSLVFRKKL